MLTRFEHFFDTHLFRTAARAMLFGTLLSFAVQSSSIPTSLAIPLAAAGVLKLSQLYPFSLGANLGSTARGPNDTRNLDRTSRRFMIGLLYQVRVGCVELALLCQVIPLGYRVTGSRQYGQRTRMTCKIAVSTSWRLISGRLGLGGGAARFSRRALFPRV